MSKALVYCRVSTDDQEKEGTSLTTQLEACLRYCQDRGYEVIRTFNETYSGTTLDRPQLTAMRDMVASGEADTLVIYCLDRLSRDPTHGVILFQEFESLHTSVEAVTENVDSTEIGKLISYIRGFASKLEVEKIRERTVRGKAAHLKQGHLPTGTGIGPCGYRWDKVTKKRVVIEQEATVVKRIYALFLDGQSLTHIAHTLNQAGCTTKAGLAWCHTTVRRVVTNPIYAGITYYGQRKRVNRTRIEHQDKDKWVLLPDVTPPIVTQEAFDEAQHILSTAKRSVQHTPSTYFLTGLMFCPDCGSPICGATLNGKYRYYRCRGTMPTRTRGTICEAHYIRADEVESFVWKRFVQLMSQPRALLAYIKATDDATHQPTNLVAIIDQQIKTLHRKLATYDAKEKRYIEMLGYEVVTRDYVLQAIENLKRQKADDQRQIDQLLDSRAQATRIANMTASLFNLEVAMHNVVSSSNLTADMKKRALGAFGIRVAASPGSYRFTVSLLQLTSDDCRDSFKPGVVWYDTNGCEHDLPECNGLAQLQAIADPDYSEDEVNAILKGLDDDGHEVEMLERYISRNLTSDRACSSTTSRFTTIEQTSGYPCLNSVGAQPEIPFLLPVDRRRRA